MIEAVRKLEFEKAALLRDQITFLRGEGGEKKLQRTSVGGYKKILMLNYTTKKIFLVKMLHQRKMPV